MKHGFSVAFAVVSETQDITIIIMLVLAWGISGFDSKLLFKICTYLPKQRAPRGAHEKRLSFRQQGSCSLLKLPSVPLD